MTLTDKEKIIEILSW